VSSKVSPQLNKNQSPSSSRSCLQMLSLPFCLISLLLRRPFARSRYWQLRATIALSFSGSSVLVCFDTPEFVAHFHLLLVLETVVSQAISPSNMCQSDHGNLCHPHLEFRTELVILMLGRETLTMNDLSAASQWKRIRVFSTGQATTDWQYRHIIESGKSFHFCGGEIESSQSRGCTLKGY